MSCETGLCLGFFFFNLHLLIGDAANSSFFFFHIHKCYQNCFPQLFIIIMHDTVLQLQVLVFGQYTQLSFQLATFVVYSIAH